MRERKRQREREREEKEVERINHWFPKLGITEWYRTVTHYSQFNNRKQQASATVLIQKTPQWKRRLRFRAVVYKTTHSEQVWKTCRSQEFVSQQACKPSQRNALVCVTYCEVRMLSQVSSTWTWGEVLHKKKQSWEAKWQLLLLTAAPRASHWFCSYLLAWWARNVQRAVPKTLRLLQIQAKGSLPGSWKWIWRNGTIRTK